MGGRVVCFCIRDVFLSSVFLSIEKSFSIGVNPEVYSIILAAFLVLY